VSQPSIMSALGFVPSRPIEPVTNGRSSGSAARPLSAFATPAPSNSATRITSGPAPIAPWPIRIATRSPAFRISAARCRSSSRGTTSGSQKPIEECTAPCSRGGSS
jgi:hypothetical protein